jgi:catechol 2,3-dioxygenase-like lactoylglutathione lyase family enzyme
MKKHIGAISLLVRDYDEAISFYVGKLGFKLIEDTDMGAGKRWIRVAPRDSAESCLLLTKASSPEQRSRVGNQTGGRVFLFLHTDDFQRDYEVMKSKGVQFLEEPRNESYGTVVVFEDLYGNKWDLLEVKA